MKEASKQTNKKQKQNKTKKKKKKNASRGMSALLTLKSTSLHFRELYRPTLSRAMPTRLI